jgi:prepilin-type N-terminal cleavage/methylation domain-containing protein
MTVRRAFTMMELAVTLAIAGILGLAATSLFSLLITSFVQIERQTVLSDRILSVGQFLSSEIASIGGNGVSSKNAIFIDHNCASKGDYPACANGSDRIRVYSALSNAPSCRVFDATPAGSDIIVSLWQQNRRGEFFCCLNDHRNDIRASSSVPQYLRRHALLDAGEFHKAVLLTAAPATALPPPSPQKARDSGAPDASCTFRLVDVAAPAERIEPPTVAGWKAGTVVLADYRAMFINTDNQLMLHLDKDENNGGANPTVVNVGTDGPVYNYGWEDYTTSSEKNELFVIADGVFDLQIRLGYDDDDTDGNETPLVSPPSTPGPRHVLRMIDLDYIMGMRARGLSNTVVTPGRTAAALAGLSVPSTLLRGAAVRVAPRNQDEREAL